MAGDTRPSMEILVRSGAQTPINGTETVSVHQNPCVHTPLASYTLVLAGVYQHAMLIASSFSANRHGGH